MELRAGIGHFDPLCFYGGVDGNRFLYLIEASIPIGCEYAMVGSFRMTVGRKRKVSGFRKRTDGRLQIAVGREKRLEVPDQVRDDALRQFRGPIQFFGGDFPGRGSGWVCGRGLIGREGPVLQAPAGRGAGIINFSEIDTLCKKFDQNGGKPGEGEERVQGPGNTWQRGLLQGLGSLAESVQISLVGEYALERE